MARAMGTNAYGKEPRRGERTLSRGFTHRGARKAFLRPYGAGASLGRSHRAYALGYFLVPLTQLPHYICRKWPILSLLDLDVSLYQRACPKTPKIVTNYGSHLGAGGRPPVAAVAIAHDFFRSSS